MATFVLVHGAWHGGWCWDRLRPELEARGHDAVAVELGAEDPDATFETYADRVAEAMAGIENPILVAHSLGGLTAPLVPVRHPVAHIVYVCALVPTPGKSFLEMFESDTDVLFPEYVAYLSEPDEHNRTRWVDDDGARQILFNDCDDASAAWAIERLGWQGRAGYGSPCPLMEFPAVPSTYVLTTEDRLVNQEWSRSTGAPRAGADIVELPGGHSPFLSRPAELAELLAQL